MFSKRKVSTALFLTLTVFLSGCDSAGGGIIAHQVVKCPAVAPMTDDMWLKDIDYLHTELPKAHRDLYHSMTKQTFDRKISDLKEEVPKLKEYEIECEIAKIVAAAKDAHTNLNFITNKNASTYPIMLNWFGSDLRVILTDKQHKNILGKNLIAVNGKPINDVTQKVNTLVSHENNQWLKAVNAQYITIPRVLEGLKLTSQEKTQFSFKGDDNKIIKVQLVPKKMTRNNVVEVKDNMPVKPICLQYNPYNLKERLYWYKYIPQDKILYFQYNSCTDRSKAESMGIENYEEYPDFDEFSEGLLKEINNNDVNKLVVDLRNNEGGDSSLMSNLISKFENVQKLQGKNKIFVLTGKNTFSSGVLAAEDFKNYTKAVFVGEPTGGNANGYGEVGTLMLPNSRLKVTYSKKYFDICPEFQGSFMPEVNVEESYEDYKKGIDDVYEAVKNYRAN